MVGREMQIVACPDEKRGQQLQDLTTANQVLTLGGSWKTQGVTSLLGTGVLGLEGPGLSALVVAEPCLPLSRSLAPSAASVLAVWMLPSELFLCSSGSKSSPKKPCSFLWNLLERLRLEPVDERVEVLATEGRLSSPHGIAPPLGGIEPGDIWAKSSDEEL